MPTETGDRTAAGRLVVAAWLANYRASGGAPNANASSPAPRT